MKKMCCKCKILKDVTEFYQRKKYRTGEYYEKCKVCMKVRGRSYYHLNKERQLPLALKRKQRYKQERKKFIDSFKNRPCMDCGKIYPPWIMDFDHREGEKKITSISLMILRNTSNLEKIKSEIAKCDLVCSNCHRQRTHDRIQKAKLAAIANVVKALV